MKSLFLSVDNMEDNRKGESPHEISRSVFNHLPE
jgi:hypothetical protein